MVQPGHYYPGQDDDDQLPGGPNCCQHYHAQHFQDNCCWGSVITIIDKIERSCQVNVPSTPLTYIMYVQCTMYIEDQMKANDLNHSKWHGLAYHGMDWYKLWHDVVHLGLAGAVKVSIR